MRYFLDLYVEKPGKEFKNRWGLNVGSSVSEDLGPMQGHLEKKQSFENSLGLLVPYNMYRFWKG